MDDLSWLFGMAPAFAASGQPPPPLPTSPFDDRFGAAFPNAQNAVPSSAPLPPVTTAQAPVAPVTPVSAGPLPPLGASLEPGTTGDTTGATASTSGASDNTDFSSVNKQGGDQQKKLSALLETLRGVKVPPPPEAQRVATPAAPIARHVIQSGQLMQLLAALQGGGGTSPKYPATLGQALGRG